MNNTHEITIKKVSKDQDHPVPSYATHGSAGADLYADLSEAQTLLPGERCLVGTGIALSLPIGVEAQIRSRSGLSFKHGVVVLNAPGTIDSDYRGEIKIILFNTSNEPFVIEPKMRIAQMVIAQHVQAAFVETENLDETVRAAGGFGSTGLR